jgi:FkbM family methyltransferase
LAIRYHAIDLIIDVGANAGQYASELFRAGFEGFIHSIEPQPEAHYNLKKAALGNDRWKVLEPLAAGDREGVVEMTVAGNSLSSSILPMLPRHVQAAPDSAPVGHIQVPQRTIDQLFSGVLNSRSTLLKIDTQGYEPQVLAGAKDTLKYCRLVQLELTLQPLYDGQQLWLDVMRSMTQSGFELWSMHPELCDPRTGQLLQLNGLFSRTS